MRSFQIHSIDTTCKIFKLFSLNAKLFNKLENEFIEQNRHYDSQLQREYDKRFGLMLFHKKLDYLVLQYFKVIDFHLSDTVLTLEVLEEILFKHGLAFAATSLPANLNDSVRLEFSNLAEYLLNNRYGFCFHHNIVAFEALKQLGFNVELLAAHMRVEPDYNEALPLATHVCILLTFQGKKYLLDPGWGSSSLKPLPLDEKDTPKSAYHISRLSEHKFALVENKKVYYEFSCTPVKINDFALGLKYVMSKQHDFFNRFFYTQKLPNGDMQYLVNRKYTYVDVKGKNESEDLNCPSLDVLQSKFNLNHSQITRLTQRSFPNSRIQKIILESNSTKNHFKINN